MKKFGKKIKTPESEAQGKGCGMGCMSYIFGAMILGFADVDLEGGWIWVMLGIGAIIGYGVYKNELPKLEKQEAEKKEAALKKKEAELKKKKASEDATKKEKKRVEEKIDKLKSDAGVEEEEGTEEDQKRRYQEYLDSIKKKK